MVLRNSEPGRRVRVGGLNWVSTRLYPLVKAACPDHPLLRETRREVLEDLLDVPAAERWLERAAGGPIPIAAGPLAVRRRLDRAGPGRFPAIRAARRSPAAAARAVGASGGGGGRMSAHHPLKSRADRDSGARTVVGPAKQPRCRGDR